MTGIPEKVIELYATYFFDIDRRDYDFMFDVAVCRPRHPGPAEPLATQVLKLGAWKGGRAVLERLVELDDDTLAGMHPRSCGLADGMPIRKSLPQSQHERPTSPQRRDPRVGVNHIGSDDSRLLRSLLRSQSADCKENNLEQAMDEPDGS